MRTVSLLGDLKVQVVTASDNEESPHLNTRENGSGNSTDRGQNSTGASSSAEFKKLSRELKLRISRVMDEVMNSVRVQIQRTINDAISTQILPQIQNAFKARSGQTTQKGWNVLDERPEYDTEDCRKDRIKSNSKNEHVRNRLIDDHADQAYDNMRQIIVFAQTIIAHLNRTYTKFCGSPQ